MRYLIRLSQNGCGCSLDTQFVELLGALGAIHTCSCFTRHNCGPLRHTLILCACYHTYFVKAVAFIDLLGALGAIHTCCCFACHNCVPFRHTIILCACYHTYFVKAVLHYIIPFIAHHLSYSAHSSVLAYFATQQMLSTHCYNRYEWHRLEKYTGSGWLF